MKERTKNGIFWTVYSIIIFIILQAVIENVFSIIYKSRFAATQVQNGIGLVSVFGEGGIFGLIASIVIPIVIIYFIIKSVDINRINEFLKPNKFKINAIAIIFVLIVALGLLSGYYYSSGYSNQKLDILNNILIFRVISFSFFGFMEILFPIIIYYLIICTIYKISRKK